MLSSIKRVACAQTQGHAMCTAALGRSILEFRVGVLCSQHKIWHCHYKGCQSAKWWQGQVLHILAKRSTLLTHEFRVTLRPGSLSSAERRLTGNYAKRAAQPLQMVREFLMHAVMSRHQPPKVHVLPLQGVSVAASDSTCETRDLCFVERSWKA